MSTAAEVASAAGPGVGFGITAWAGFKFVRWLIEFVWKRLDIRNARLDAKEKALEARYDARLAHLERELARTRRGLTLLFSEVATQNPQNKVLQRVAELLHPLNPELPLNRAIAPDAEFDELTQRAGEALDGTA